MEAIESLYNAMIAPFLVSPGDMKPGRRIAYVKKINAWVPNQGGKSIGVMYHMQEIQH